MTTKKRLCGNCPAHDLQARIEELMEERRDLYKQVQEYARCISLEQEQNKKMKNKFIAMIKRCDGDLDFLSFLVEEKL
jgi:shikimate kinase